MNSLTTVSYFLITTVFSLIIFILWARLFFRYFAVNRFSPISLSVYQLTDPIITPIQKHLIRAKDKRGPYDFGCLILLIIVELFKVICLNALFLKSTLSVMDLLFCALINMIVTPCNILFYAILIRVIISFVNPLWKNPITHILFDITEPLLHAIRRRLPDVGPIDLSPLVALILLKVLEIIFLGFLPFPML